MNKNAYSVYQLYRLEPLKSYSLFRIIEPEFQSSPVVALDFRLGLQWNSARGHAEVSVLSGLSEKKKKKKNVLHDECFTDTKAKSYRHFFKETKLSCNCDCNCNGTRSNQRNGTLICRS